MFRVLEHERITSILVPSHCLRVFAEREHWIRGCLVDRIQSRSLSPKHVNSDWVKFRKFNLTNITGTKNELNVFKSTLASACFNKLEKQSPKSFRLSLYNKN